MQRATLLNRILLDVYGEQRLLREGLCRRPWSTVMRVFCDPAAAPSRRGGHAALLRSTSRARPTAWWVIDDRTQAPSGAGYALENRIIISRAFPQLFRDLKVQHLARFFATLRDGLAHWAPQDRGAPLDGAADAWARTTRPISSTPTSPVTSACRSWKGATSPCATAASG